jgi:hypothetical protein
MTFSLTSNLLLKRNIREHLQPAIVDKCRHNKQRIILLIYLSISNAQVLGSCGSFTVLDSQKLTIAHFHFGRGYDG